MRQQASIAGASLAAIEWTRCASGGVGAAQAVTAQTPIARIAVFIGFCTGWVRMAWLLCGKMPDGKGDCSVKIAIILVGLLDWALAVLLVAVSGFLFGSGPESGHAGTAALIGWIAMVIVCIAAPIVGFVLAGRGRPGVGILLAIAPIFVAIVVAFLPIHPY